MDSTSNILVVDDEPSYRDVLARQLSRLGYQCETAEDGPSALERLRTGSFEVAVIDWMMPGMDGIELIKAMTEDNLDTVPVVVSGVGTISGAVSAMHEGAFDFLEKGHSLDMLGSVVQRALTHYRLRRHARAMEQSADQWATTFDAVPELIAIIDSDSHLVKVNKAMANRLGVSPEAAVGMKCCACIHGEEEAPGDCPHQLLLGDCQQHTGEIYSEALDGHFMASTSPLLDAQNRLAGCVYVLRDISEQRRIQEELRSAHAELHKLVSSMSSFIIGVDQGLCISRWNPAAHATFGIAAEQVLDKPFLECGIEWDWTLIRRDLGTWQSVDQPILLPELRYFRRDGTEGVLSITVNPLRNEDTTSSGFFLLGNDITEYKQLEMQLVQAQKLESIGQLASGIAHEINTPTQYIGDNVQFLQDAFSDLTRLIEAHARLLDAVRGNEAAAAAVGEVESVLGEVDMEFLAPQIPKAIQQSLDGIDRIAKIVRAMKEFSHPGSAQKTHADINRAIESTVTVARNELKYVAEVVTELDPSLPMVPCLPGEFNQVILNILINAAHAIADVTAGQKDAKGTIRISTRQEGPWAEIRISDTGGGIPANVRSRIFDPFFTTKPVGRGTGQGLAIARSVIVKKHQGDILVESEPGKGTTFIIRLPLEDQTESEAQV
jgi:PAS domain S-box-containing protein